MGSSTMDDRFQGQNLWFFTLFHRGSELRSGRHKAGIAMAMGGHIWSMARKKDMGKENCRDVVSFWKICFSLDMFFFYLESSMVGNWTVCSTFQTWRAVRTGFWDMAGSTCTAASSLPGLKGVLQPAHESRKKGVNFWCDLCICLINSPCTWGVEQMPLITGVPMLCLMADFRSITTFVAEPIIDNHSGHPS